MSDKSRTHQDQIDFNPFELVGQTVIHNGEEKKVKTIGGKFLSNEGEKIVEFYNGDTAPVEEVIQK